MKSSNEKSNALDNYKLIQMEHIRDKIDYIDELLSDVGDNILLMFVVLNTQEKLLCLYDIKEENMLYLVIHLVDYVDDNGNVSYLFYPYHSVADQCSEIILSEQPSVMASPSQRFIDAYFNYWAKYISSLEYELTELSDEEPEDTLILYPGTNTLS